MELDYDQLLAKRPHKHDAVFACHQDMPYWPDTPDTRTATVWLAIDDSTIENGCMRFVPATTHEQSLRPHAPMFSSRGTSHALGTERALGFTHSHNDELEILEEVGIDGETHDVEIGRPAPS